MGPLIVGAAAACLWAAPELAIYGGGPAGLCDFPSAVSIDDRCSGTLVHPQVVVFAGHCGADVTQIGLGANASAPDRALTPAACHVHPAFDPNSKAAFDPNDVAFCTLTAAVTDLPYTPIMMGCELASVQAGTQVAAVGYGLDEAGNSGSKRAVTTTVDAISALQVSFGGNGQDTCDGDSGGPLYVQLNSPVGLTGQPDGAWRVLGGTVTGVAGDATTDCGKGTLDTILARAVPWIEATSGLDISPCFAADGTWAPGAACDHLPLEVHTTQSGTTCGTPQMSDYAATCGKPFVPAATNLPVTAPASGTPSVGTSGHRGGGCAQAGGTGGLGLLVAAAAGCARGRRRRITPPAPPGGSGCRRAGRRR